MADSLETATRNAMINAAVDLIDAGSAAGEVEIQTAGSTVLATITLSDPAFGAASSGSCTLNGTPLSDTNAAATGTASKAVFKDSDGNVVFTLDIGLAGAGKSVTIDSTSISAGDTVRITAGTVTQPASA